MAQKFCEMLSEAPEEWARNHRYRLPTEAEWEYACRAGGQSVTAFTSGDALTVRDANFNGEVGRTTAVGSYPANRLSLFDMHGNVWEWCRDWYGEDYYRNSPPQDPTGPGTGERRVLRGGCWNNLVRYCRAASRKGKPPESFNNDRGFRVVLVVSGRPGP
jgi:formylglycine-generating enzyme required for sulfatase activity